jgi:exopolysaccharide production protein ExoY
MASIPVYRSAYKTQNDWVWQCIQAAERPLSALLIVALSPLFCAIWLAIWFLSGRSPMIAHRRVGHHGSELWVLKFRTMWERRKEFTLRYALSVEHIDDQDGPALKSRGDSRIASAFACFCRQHSLDELPQLIHVLLGQMSLIGPRPVTAAELGQIYGSKAPEILRVKPGLSGLWQVSGRNRLTPEERCSLDLECAHTRSLKLYFSIVARTIPEVFKGESAW